ncbi:general secretion pathway protein GspD [Massilia sp. P8910]|uniref:cohesin domain-containing protein n=1 Tax=Massilia antarctica TaxID=2765360 RepID=UPI001E4335D3|nr:cohesin domain-containing protein [Massilia antarctica]MCE3603619.1 general secretion pathway protein GspD [Massilia antarctica]
MFRFEKVVLATTVVLMTACTGSRLHSQGLTLLADGKVEDGIRHLEQAVIAEPRNAEFKTDLIRRRTEEVNRLLATAEAARAAGKFDAALGFYKRVQDVELGNTRAAQGAEAVERERRSGALLEQAQTAFKQGELDAARFQVKAILGEHPNNAAAITLKREIDDQAAKLQLADATLIKPTSPITLEFRDANLKMVLDGLSRATGISFMLDKDIQPDLRTTINVRQASLNDVLDIILQSTRLEKKVINPTSILLYPRTPEKLKEHQELLVKGFYLANADVKQTQAMLKELLKAKDVFIDEKLNLLVMRDTPDAIRLAEKLISMQDLSEPEVMLEVEVLEVKRSRLMELGVKLPNQLTLTPLVSGASATLDELRRLNSDNIALGLPTATLNLRREIGDVKILANPRIRARNREKAKVMIGDKIPVVSITTTSNGVSSESVQYLDVGIKLDVEPNIYLQDEVAIKVGLEVSSLVREIRTPAGSLAYQIGSRSASTVLRLKNGETQVLAGLINDEERRTASRLPGLGDIPMLGRLFSSQKDESEQTEIVLSITPRLVRNINKPEAIDREFWSGTEVSLRSKKLTTAVTENATEPTRGASVNPAAPPAKDASNLAPTAVSLSWQGPEQAKVGELLKVAIVLKADGGVRSLPFQLGFDPSALQIVEIAEGDFFKKGGASTSMSNNIDHTLGKAFVSVIRSGTDGAFGQDTVVTLTLRPLAAKAHSELKFLMSSPISVGDKPLVLAPPAPLTITIVN